MDLYQKFKNQWEIFVNKEVIVELGEKHHASHVHEIFIEKFIKVNSDPNIADLCYELGKTRIFNDYCRKWINENKLRITLETCRTRKSNGGIRFLGMKLRNYPDKVLEDKKNYQRDLKAKYRRDDGVPERSKRIPKPLGEKKNRYEEDWFIKEILEGGLIPDQDFINQLEANKLKIGIEDRKALLAKIKIIKAQSLLEIKTGEEKKVIFMKPKISIPESSIDWNKFYSDPNNEIDWNDIRRWLINIKDKTDIVDFAEQLITAYDFIEPWEDCLKHDPTNKDLLKRIETVMKINNVKRSKIKFDSIQTENRSEIISDIDKIKQLNDMLGPSKLDFPSGTPSDWERFMSENKIEIKKEDVEYWFKVIDKRKSKMNAKRFDKEVEAAKKIIEKLDYFNSEQIKQIINNLYDESQTRLGRPIIPVIVNNNTNTFNFSSVAEQKT